jgi:hypothetical protein
MRDEKRHRNVPRMASHAGVKPEPKVIERIKKLLRLASPKSGATESERASAALTALDLCEQHGITLDINAVHAHEPRRPVEDRTYIVRNIWLRTQAQDAQRCAHCGGKISRGDMIYVRAIPGVGFECRHHYKPCGIE